MPRPPRIRLPDTTLHVVQRGNNRARTFYAEQDYHLYLALLKFACRRYETQVHAYVLMTNHVHLLLTPRRTAGVSRTIQYVASRYVVAVNSRVGRTGTLWEGRFRSSPIDSDRYLLACYRYIELNPVRAGIARQPGAYRWSSFSTNASAKESTLVTPHPTYLALGHNAATRGAAYRALFKERLDEEVIADLRNGLRAGLPAGSERFRQSLEVSLARPIGRRGRRHSSTKLEGSEELKELKGSEP